MNQIFSSKRFVWLLKRQWMENSAFYKWGMAIIVVVIPVIQWSFILWRMNDKRPEMGHELVVVILSIFLWLYASYYFIQTLGSKSKRMFSFSLPVLPLEQVMVAFVYIVVLVPAYVFAVFCINDYLFVQLFNDIHEVSEQMLISKSLQTSFGLIDLFILHLVYLFYFVPIFALCSFFLRNRGLFISFGLYISALSFISYKKVWELYCSCFFGMFFCVCLIHAFCWTLIYFGMKNKELV